MDEQCVHDPSQVLIDHHQLNNQQWGMSLNAVTSLVLFHNAFLMEEEIIAFLEEEVLSNLPDLANLYDDLVTKV